MKTSAINVIVQRAFDALDLLSCITHTDHRFRMLELTRAEEKLHRRGVKGQCKAATVEAAARMFVVMRIAEAMLDARPPAIEDYICTQKSVFYAASVVANYSDEIKKAWQGFDVRKLAELDYVKFVNDGESPL